jgi:hypothetical protein
LILSRGEYRLRAFIERDKNNSYLLEYQIHIFMKLYCTPEKASSHTLSVSAI